MFNSRRKADLLENQRLSCSLEDMKAKALAVSRSMAIIEFTPEGIILEANDNFCRAMGYT
ncbi:pili assembly chaperone, partial [Pseudomonas sp. FSL R10-0071]|nr:pili assembly chaperone [Pseudomonas sp. FSL R10-0071]